MFAQVIRYVTTFLSLLILLVIAVIVLAIDGRVNRYIVAASLYTSGIYRWYISEEVFNENISNATKNISPKGDDAELLRNLMKKSYELLKEHPVNKKRMAEGKNPANSLWIWGQGKKPNLSSFTEKYGIKGTAISAVDLIKGIALCAGLDSADIEGATGTLHTSCRSRSARRTRSRPGC